MTEPRRTPDEVKHLFERLKKQKKREGINYQKIDFVKDLGYSRAAAFSDITTDPPRDKHSKQADIIMDYMEKELHYPDVFKGPDFDLNEVRRFLSGE